MRTPLRRSAVAALLVAVLLLSVASPASALLLSGVVAVCSGGIRITFSSAITDVPMVANTITLSTPTPLTCSGAFSGTASVSMVTAATEPGTSCTGPLAAVGSGSVTLSGSIGTLNAPETIVGGTTPAPTFELLSNPPMTVEAVGAGVWTDAGEITSCAGAGTTTVTTTAALVIVA